MEQITITKTKDYLVLKIPTKALQRQHAEFNSHEERAIQEGLRALENGKISKQFRGIKKAIAFLRCL